MRDRYAGMGPFVGVAAVSFVIGIIAVLLEIQSPSIVQWDGLKVRGVTTGGIAYYHYHGHLYAVNNPHASANDRSQKPTTIWLKRSDPTDFNSAYVENAWSRWMDFTVVTMWFFFAAIILAVGFLRRWRRRQRIIKTMGHYGSGLSDEVVRRLLEKRRQPRRPLLISDDDL